MAKLSAKESLSDLPKSEQDSYRQKLSSVGISDKLLQDDVFIGGPDTDFAGELYDAIEGHRNVLILGSSGFGKTGIVTQVARQLGRNLVNLTVSTRLPEDFGGRPMGDQQKLPNHLIKAKIAAIIKSEKVKASIDAKIAEQEKLTGTPLSSYQKEKLTKQLILDTPVTDQEIAQRIAEGNDNVPTQRLREIYAAPNWVYNILDDYLLRGKESIIFLDEINQASPDVLNTLFQLVAEKRFGDNDEYRMEDAVSFVAAGNFMDENSSLNKLPVPLIRRFGFIMVNPRNWTEALTYLYKKYLGINKGIADLIRSVPVSEWERAIHDPARLEEKISFLLRSIENGKRLRSVGAIIGLPGVAQQKVEEFMTKQGLLGNARFTASSPINTTTQTMQQIQYIWKDFKSKHAAKLPDGKGGYVPDPTSTSASSSGIGVFSWGRPGSREAFKSALMDLYESSCLDEEFWTSLE